MKRLLIALTLTASMAFAIPPERLEALLERFPEADLNKDGKLSEGEALAYRDKIQQRTKSDRKAKRSERITPDHSDVAYGEHERQRFDVWIPEKTDDPRLFPVLVYFHGGGFVAGDKSQFDPAPYLSHGIACASVNYRLVDGIDALSPIPFEDSTRALQSIRHQALDWGLDPGRIALSGGSAGGVIALWLAYHDDLADPDSEDPVARQSTRVTCVIPLNTPTNLMPDWIVENIGGSQSVHGSFPKLFGEPVSSPLADSLRTKVAEVSPWEQVSADDPPTHLIYSGPLDETPLPASATSGKVIHHPAFGVALKKRLDELGIENELRHGFDPRGTPNLPEYLMTQFGMLD